MDGLVQRKCDIDVTIYTEMLFSAVYHTNKGYVTMSMSEKRFMISMVEEFSTDTERQYVDVLD